MASSAGCPSRIAAATAIAAAALRVGGGVPALKRAIVEQGQHVNARRRRRGLNPRPVRAAILGYPNVGKSALINRLVGRRKTKSENRPGVTRGFSWIGIDKDVQLLDSPGIIPAKQVRRSTAQFLAQFPARNSRRNSLMRRSSRDRCRSSRRTTWRCATTSASRRTTCRASPPRSTSA